MKILILLVAVVALLSACSNPSNKTQPAVESVSPAEIVITNDLENALGVMPSWFNENTIVAMTEPQAHSGNYSGLTNDTLPYGYTYKETLKNIDPRLPKIAFVSGWIYTTVANPDFSIICGINENKQTYNWKAYPLTEILSETGKWIEFTATFYFDDKPLKPEHEISIYGLNNSKKAIYTDDLKITFTY